MNVELLTTPHQLAPLLPEIVEVYRDGFATNQDEADRFRTDQLVKHPQRKGFLLAYATVDDQLAGFGYGYTGQAGQWWTDRMRERVPAEVYAEWFEGHFELVELAVRPAFQRNGIGSALHDRLIDGLPHERGLLTTGKVDSPAQRLYLRTGWRVLADVDDDTILMGILLSTPREGGRS